MNVLLSSVDSKCPMYVCSNYILEIFIEKVLLEFADESWRDRLVTALTFWMRHKERGNRGCIFRQLRTDKD